MANIINLPEYLNIINFKSLNDDIYGIYNPKITSLNKIINTLFDNYSCDGLCHDTINLYSNTHKKYLTDLNKCLSMQDLGFNNSSIIYLKYKDSHKYQDIKKMIGNINNMCIYIKTLTGKELKLQVTSSTTIEDVKYLIQNIEGIPPDQQKLYYNGITLDTECTLSSYNICNDAILHLKLALKGGMFHETSGRNGNYKSLKSNIFFVESDIK